MAAVTTYRGGPKPFTWSYSRLKNFETCRKRHYEVDIAKSTKEEESDALLWGNFAHDVLAKRLSEKRLALPPQAVQFEPYCQRLEATPGLIQVEQQAALTKDFAPCGYFDKNVWFRAKIDVKKIMGPVALVVDWKTGKIVPDSVQLALSAACVFAQHPEIMKIRSRFIWLAEDAETDEDFTREDMPAFWRSIWPRIQALEDAYKTTSYPADPGRLCRKWCPVSSCVHHGT